jgi:hypothetical protein
LRTTAEQYCSTAVLSRFPTSVAWRCFPGTLRLASQARQEGGWGQPPNNKQCSTAVLSRFPTSVSLALLSRNSQTRLASSAGGRLRTTAEQYCSTAVLSRFPTSVSLALLSRNSQTRLASTAGGRLRTTAEQRALFNGCPQPFSDKRSLALLSRNSQTRLASSAGGRLRTTAEQYCSTAVLSRFPTSVAWRYFPGTLRHASQARQEDG